jgi:hypothetical protein
MAFLAKHFTFLGFEFQVWMPIVVGGVGAYIAYLWKTDKL